MRKKQKDWAKEMAYQRILRLFELARSEFREHPERSNRYVTLARRIGMRYRVRMPPELKRQICKHCHTYLVQGLTAHTRLKNTCIVLTCFSCGKQMRLPYKNRHWNRIEIVPEDFWNKKVWNPGPQAAGSLNYFIQVTVIVLVSVWFTIPDGFWT